jgi:O-antigen/teichoic acid export membrane protein
VFAVTGPLAPDLTVLLFGEAYADSGPVLALLSIGYYFSAVMGFNTYTLQVCERIRFLVVVNVSVALFNIALSLLLGWQYGAVGVATANMTSLVVLNLLNQWALRRAIGTAFIDRTCVRSYLAIFAGATGLWTFQTLVHPGFAIGLVVAAATSFAVLLASRNAMELGETFPELRNVPLVRRIVR